MVCKPAVLDLLHWALALCLVVGDVEVGLGIGCKMLP